jgi:hypothetical protein
MGFDEKLGALQSKQDLEFNLAVQKLEKLNEKSKLVDQQHGQVKLEAARYYTSVKRNGLEKASKWIEERLGDMSVANLLEDYRQKITDADKEIISLQNQILDYNNLLKALGDSEEDELNFEMSLDFDSGVESMINPRNSTINGRSTTARSVHFNANPRSRKGSIIPHEEIDHESETMATKSRKSSAMTDVWSESEHRNTISTKPPNLLGFESETETLNSHKTEPHQLKIGRRGSVSSASTVQNSEFLYIILLFKLLTLTKF